MTTNQKNERIGIKKAFKLCLPIGVIIFATAVLSDFSVKFYSAGGTNVIIGVFMDFIGIMLVTLVLTFMVMDSKKYRRMITRMFGAEDEE
jgi:hypothetical protein